MVSFKKKDRYDVSDLREIVRLLRAPGGCPWDAEQTHESIRRNFLEEAYEVAEAIDEGAPEGLCEELGDVLLQVVFHSQIAQEAGGFSLDEVADAVSKKLIFRHPHVFGEARVDGTGEVLRAWEDLKREEKGQQTHSDALESVARSLPALWRAEKIQQKARKAGFDWPDAGGALEKLHEELAELQSAMSGAGDPAEELGDLLFAAVNLARHLKIDPEEALSAASDKFTRRFRAVETAAAAEGSAMEKLPLAELDRLWEAAKQPQSPPRADETMQTKELDQRT